MNKKTLIILITLIIIMGIICGIAFSKNSNKNITTNTQKQDENISTNQEISYNTNQIEENIIDENGIDENNNIENTQTTIQPNESQETPKTEEEKAIEIVKNDRGVSDTIKFEIEGKDSKGRIIVVVRNIQTTEALQFYHVDVSNGTFIKE